MGTGLESRGEAGVDGQGTRITPPAPQTSQVSRPRLVQRVDGGTRNPLTLISAPAGSGKTTLLAEWVAVDDHPGEVVRLSLGPEAEGPRAFWGVVAAAVPGFAAFDERPGYGARVLDSLSARDEPLVLVLDDFNGVG